MIRYYLQLNETQVYIACLFVNQCVVLVWFLTEKSCQAVKTRLQSVQAYINLYIILIVKINT